MEEWREIKGSNGKYLVSESGLVWSCHRNKLLKFSEHLGYYRAHLFLNKKPKVIGVHLLVWDAFGDAPRDGYKLQVDHIDNDKKNNHISNLQLLTPRQNITKSKKPREYPTGVLFCNKYKKITSKIYIDGKSKHLGYFKTVEEASNAYKRALAEYLRRDIVSYHIQC